MATEKQRLTFISYSRDDKNFALELAKELRASGFLIWLDQLDIPTGSRWDDEVQRALEQCQIFMVILTPNSIASNNVKDEIGYAIDSNKHILPVLLEQANIPFRLRRFQYVDFTNKSYNEGIDLAKQLLSKLLYEPTGPSPSIPAEARSREARVEAEPVASPDPDAIQLERRRAEAVRLARARQQLERQSQPVHSIPVANPTVSNQQPQFKTVPKLIPILAGLSLIGFLCLGGAYAYLVMSANPTPTATPIPSPTATPIFNTDTPPNPVTVEPPPGITTIPTIFPQEPGQFISFYWETIIFDKNFELAWSLLTDGFRQRNNPLGFEDWRNTMAKIINWDRPTNYNTGYISSSMATVHVDRIHFYSVNSPENGYDLEDINYCLIRDESRNTWVIEYLGACGG